MKYDEEMVWTVFLALRVVNKNVQLLLIIHISRVPEKEHRATSPSVSFFTHGYQVRLFASKADTEGTIRHFVTNAAARALRRGSTVRHVT